MANMSMFFKKNKIEKEAVLYPATKSLCDEDGKALMWQIKPISTKENERIQEECMVEVPVPGKRNEFRQKIKATAYIKKLITASITFPDLYSAELQDTYGVKTPEALIQEMIDDSGEWNALLQFVNELNGFTPIQEEVDEAKN